MNWIWTKIRMALLATFKRCSVFRLPLSVLERFISRVQLPYSTISVLFGFIRKQVIISIAN